MTGSPAGRHEYRVRFPHPADHPSHSADVEVRVAVDLDTQAITVQVPDQPVLGVDVVTARALSMLLGDAVYGSLQPSGPHLRVEKNTGAGWSTTPTPETSR